MIDFALISNKRTGSTFLQEALNSHPDIICHDELFIIRSSATKDKKGNIPFFKVQRKNKDGTEEEYLNGLSHGQRKEKIGVRIVYPQLDHGSRLTSTLVKNNVPIIHLMRYNYFEQAMSGFTKGISKNEKVEVPPADLIWRINKIRDDTDFYKGVFTPSSQNIELYYEKMFGDKKGKKKKIKQKGAFNLISNQKTFLEKAYNDKICRTLGVKMFDMNSNITKRTNPDVWEHIKNKNAVYKTLNNKGGLEGDIKK